MKIRPVGADFHESRQAYMTKDIVAVRNFANPPKKQAMCLCMYMIIIWHQGLNH